MSIAVLLALLGCGSTAKDHAGPSGNSGGQSGTSTEAGGSGGTGEPASGGSGLSDTGGNAGSTLSTSVGTSVASSTGSGGAGGSGVPPIPNEREREILGVLWMDASALETATGDELLELGHLIAIARGYAVCRCALSPNAPPDDIDAIFDSCVYDEAAPFVLGTPDQVQCVRALRDQAPGLDEYLRCIAQGALATAAYWLLSCTDLALLAPVWPDPICPEPVVGFDVINMICSSPYYCEDGTLTAGRRCNGSTECMDLSDEFQCYDDTGRDNVYCDGWVVVADQVCQTNCALAQNPPACVADRLNVLRCSDGSEVATALVCDREADCPEGEDEAWCFR